MRSIVILITGILLGTAGVLQAQHAASRNIAKQQGRQNMLTNDVHDTISVGSVTQWLSNTGRTSYNPITDGSGFEWPKGSRKYCIFSEGLLVGGRGDDSIFVAGATYNAGLQAGWIRPDGSASDPMDPRSTIFRVRNLTTAGYNALPSQVKSRLQSSFTGWPVERGAPWIDRNNNGVYDPNFTQWLADHSSSDAPLILGDEAMWFVSNDLDPVRTNHLYGSAPVGLEIQTYAWASDQDPFRYAVFMRHTIINKGVMALRNVCISEWMDPDLGDSNDDLVGIDTTRSLAFTYNGTATDGVYGDAPALGCMILQSPIVPAAPDQSARWQFGRRQGWRNLPVSAFSFYINGNPVYDDPKLFDAFGKYMMYNYMQGLLWTGQQQLDPTDNHVVHITLPGDPVTRTGWIDGVQFVPGDRRFLMSTGPLDLAPGDTQEIVTVNFISQGMNGEHDITALRRDADAIRSAYDNLLAVEPARVAAVAEAFSITELHPNPVRQSAVQHERLSIGIDAVRGMHVEFRVCDLLGRDVGTVTAADVAPGRSVMTLALPHALPAGSYQVIARGAGVQRISRFLVVK